MPGRGALSEEAEREESSSREWLRTAEGKLRELRERRQALLVQVRTLADDQRRLFEERQPGREALQAALGEHRSLGKELARLRAERDALRDRISATRGAMVARRPTRGRETGTSPAQVRREIAELELRQQTHALPLEEENALIERIRRLQPILAESEARAKNLEQEVRARAEKLDSLKALQEAAEQVAQKVESVHRERETRMKSMRDLLEEDGRRLAAMRAKGTARAELMTRLDAVQRTVAELERDVYRRMGESRQRRVEARRTIQEYNRSVREAVSGTAALNQSADAQLEALLKRGKVTLGG
ncbi:MAG TPA: hypothetical protein VJS68_02815 [Thermoplasmata archaeon]|nr:hypothetical protein [Thermoplasmata archaeon]